MAFNYDAFSAGLGGILQQILASKQQTQAMEQKRLDQEIPIYNQQRAWQKEDDDNAYAAEVRAHERNLRPGQITGQRLELEGLRGRNTGQGLTNEGLGLNNDITKATKPFIVDKAKQDATIAGNNATISGNQATLSTAQTGPAVTDARNLPEQERLAFISKINQAQRETQKELSTQMAIMLDPRKTFAEKQAAKTAYAAAYRALGDLHGTTNLRQFQLKGGSEAEFYNKLGFDKRLYEAQDGFDENGQPIKYLPPVPDVQSAYNGMYKDPLSIMLAASANGPESKELVKQIRDDISNLYRSDRDIKTIAPKFVPGVMPQASQFSHTWQPGNQVENWLSGNAMRTLFQNLSDNGINVREFFKQNYNIELTNDEVSAKTLGKKNRGIFKTAITSSLSQPKEFSADVTQRGVEVGRLLTVLNDLYTAQSNSTVSANNLAATLTGSFDNSNKIMLSAYNRIGSEIMAKAKTISEIERIPAESVVGNLSQLKNSQNKATKSLAEAIIDLQKRLRIAGPYIAKAGNLQVGIIRGERNARDDRQAAVTNALNILNGGDVPLIPDDTNTGGTGGTGGTGRGGVGGSTSGTGTGRGGKASGSAKVETVDLSGK